MENAPCGAEPGYAGSQSGSFSEPAPAWNFIEPSLDFTSNEPLSPSPCASIWTFWPSSSKTNLPFCASAKFMVMVLPVFLSRTVMVPLSSSVETTSTSGFAAASIRVTARAGFFSSMWAACLALCAMKYMAIPPTSAASTTRPPQPPIIQTTALVFCGAAALTGGTGADADGGTGGGAPLPGCGRAPGCRTGPGCGVAPGGGALLVAAGVPQLPQNGPWTWAPHFVQN